MDHHPVETCTVVRCISIPDVLMSEKMNWTIRTDIRNKSVIRDCVTGLGKDHLLFCNNTINAEKYPPPPSSHSMAMKEERTCTGLTVVPTWPSKDCAENVEKKDVSDTSVLTKCQSVGLMAYHLMVNIMLLSICLL